MKSLKVLLSIFISGFLVAAIGADSVSTPKEDCEKLMNAVLPFAEQMLRQHGEFFPYGGALDLNGKVVAVATYEGDEHPQSAEVIDSLKKSFVEGAKTKKYMATALVYNVRITMPSTGEKSDAIAVSLNHRDNYSVVVIFPYRLTEGDLVLEPAFAQKGEADVFTSAK